MRLYGLQKDFTFAYNVVVNVNVNVLLCFNHDVVEEDGVVEVNFHALFTLELDSGSSHGQNKRHSVMKSERAPAAFWATW
jgi:hypothetical protein